MPIVIVGMWVVIWHIMLSTADGMQCRHLATNTLSLQGTTYSVPVVMCTAFTRRQHIYV